MGAGQRAAARVDLPRQTRIVSGCDAGGQMPAPVSVASLFKLPVFLASSHGSWLAATFCARYCSIPRAYCRDLTWEVPFGCSGPHQVDLFPAGEVTAVPRFGGELDAASMGFFKRQHDGLVKNMKSCRMSPPRHAACCRNAPHRFWSLCRPRMSETASSQRWRQCRAGPPRPVPQLPRCAAPRRCVGRTTPEAFLQGAR